MKNGTSLGVPFHAEDAFFQNLQPTPRSAWSHL